MKALRNLGSRPRRDHRRALGLAALLVLAGLMALAMTGAYTVFSSPDRRTVTAVFTQTAQLQAGDPVRIDGIDVGEVDRIDTNPGARSATVVMEVDRSAGPLYRNAGAAIAWRTMLGGTFVVELERGTPGAGALGGAAIAEERTRTQVEFEDFITFAQGRAGIGLQTMQRELARTFRDPDVLADLTTTLDRVASPVARGVRATRGQRPDRDLRRLIAATARTVRALDTPTDDIRGLVEGSAAMFETTAAREADIRRFIATAPGVMRRTTGTLRRIDVTLRATDSLLAQLRRPVGAMAPTFRSLRPTIVDTDRLLRRAVPLFRSLRPAFASLTQAARGSVPLLDGLAPSLERLDETILPFMGEVDPQTQHSAAQMIGSVAAITGGGMSGPFDGNGRLERFPITYSENIVQTSPCQALLTNPDSTELATCKSLQEAIEEYFSYVPQGTEPSRGEAP